MRGLLIKKLLLPLAVPAALLAALVPALLPASVARAEEPADAPADVIETIAPDHPVRGRIHFHGTGTLAAGGSGAVYLAGHLTVTGAARGGTLTVVDHAGDAEILVEAGGARTDEAQTDQARRDRTTVVIKNLDGEFRVSGSRVEVKFEETRVRFFARGAGHAVLHGHGWYRVNGGHLHRWSPWGPRS